MLAHFELRVETAVQTPDSRLNELIRLTRDRMRLNRRWFSIDGCQACGHVTSDSINYASVWLRDMAYQIRAARYWEPDLQLCLEPFFKTQQPNGKLYDNYNSSGALHRMESESDLEYILILASYWVWQATGDTAWLEAHWEPLQRALAYPRVSDERWSDFHQLVARGHTCDTWDFNLSGFDEMYPRVVAACDVSGFYQAHRLMAQIARILGRADDVLTHDKEAVRIQAAATRHLWDGGKYLHHVHVDVINHGTFDETKQLAMGNTWAITRGLADPQQARAIIATYFERAKQTGQRPWWSLQPGYPDSLGYFEQSAARGVMAQGGYANGGLMPWVGGELCHACFIAGESHEGWELLDDYLNFLLAHDGEIFTWYWPDMRPGYRTPNTTSHCGWGMAEWVCALIEGLAGVRDQSANLKHVRITPRWSELDFADVKVVVRYGQSEDYVAYRLRRINAATLEVELTFTGVEVDWGGMDGLARRRITRLDFPSGYTRWQVKLPVPVNSTTPA
jgi:hypothetical protein